MRKRTVIKHNGKSVWIGEFNYDGKVATGYVHGRLVTGAVGCYVYTTKTNANVTEVSNAMHFLVDHYGTIYGNAPSLKGNRSHAYVKGNNVSRIRNTHIVNLGNGTCIATGEVDGVLTSIEFNGYTENGYNGMLMEAKPYLGSTRKALIEKYDKEQAKKAADKLVEFKAKYPHLIAEVMADLLA